MYWTSDYRPRKGKEAAGKRRKSEKEKKRKEKRRPKERKATKKKATKKKSEGVEHLRDSACELNRFNLAAGFGHKTKAFGHKKLLDKFHLLPWPWGQGL